MALATLVRRTAAAATAALVGLAASSPPAAPPAARRVPFEETFHGVTLTDPYHWLEDFDDPAAAAFISAQDEFARRPDRERIVLSGGTGSLLRGLEPGRGVAEKGVGVFRRHEARLSDGGEAPVSSDHDSRKADRSKAIE